MNDAKEKIEEAVAEGDLLNFDGDLYRRSQLTDQQIFSISELEQIGDASALAASMASLAKHFKTIIDLSLNAQLILRGQIKEDIEDARLTTNNRNEIAH